MHMNKSSVDARRAGLIQGLVLIACSWLSVIASGALLGPVIPTIIQHFGGGSAVEYQVAAIVGMPPLFVALFAWPMGLLADRIGARRLLIGTTLVYAVAGVAPYLLNDLDSIVWTRRVVGIAEAAVMTCSYALIGAYYTGAARERWYALSTGTAPVMALVAISLGGGLGNSDWHNVFLVYLFAIVLFVGVIVALWEPERHSAVPAVASAGAAATAESAGFRWPRFIGICALSIFVMTAFLITVIQTGSLMTERGVTSPAVIGRWQALASLANPLGALIFMFWRARFESKLTVSFILMATGFAVIGSTTDWQSVVWGAAIANLGCGMILPTVVSWGLQDSPPTIRGKISGILMACNFLGQFLSPYVMVWLKENAGGLTRGVFDYAVACALGTVLGLVLWWLASRKAEALR
jgi:MFS family permease